MLFYLFVPAIIRQTLLSLLRLRLLLLNFLVHVHLVRFFCLSSGSLALPLLFASLLRFTLDPRVLVFLNSLLMLIKQLLEVSQVMLFGSNFERSVKLLPLTLLLHVLASVQIYL